MVHSSHCMAADSTVVVVRNTGDRKNRAAVAVVEIPAPIQAVAQNDHHNDYPVHPNLDPVALYRPRPDRIVAWFANLLRIQEASVAVAHNQVDKPAWMVVYFLRPLLSLCVGSSYTTTRTQLRVTQQ